MDNARIIERITQRPSGKLDMVLDTDTYNEIDDQFAVCYALCAEDKLNVKAIYAAPFFNSMSTGPKDGMEKSYEEILKLLNSMGRSHENFVFKGSDRYLENRNTPCDNPAVRDLIEKALAQPEDRPLYVATIGAITNIASAILIEPRIIEKIVVVWLGGHTHSYPHTKEFNMYQDKTAANVVFDSKDWWKKGMHEIDVPSDPWILGNNRITMSLENGKNDLIVTDMDVKLFFE
jgi:purine nucleosidase